MISSTKSRLSWAYALARILATDHRTLAIRYLCLSLIAVAIGTLMSLTMRIE